MTLVVDSGPVVALADSNDGRRTAIERTLATEPGALVVPSPTTAEIDYLLGQRVGQAARQAFLCDLAAGRFVVGTLALDDYATIVGLEAQYRDLDLGLSDCALVCLADRYDTGRILTFDERRFRAVSPLRGGSFTILPADASA